MKDIKIYGEIVPFQDGWVVEAGFCNLTYVQNQLAEANGEDVRVRINSFGGDVEEGFAIYSELRRYAKENKSEITMLAEGRCASIATVIFLAGDKRILNEYVEPFVHDAWTYAIGDGKTIQRVADDLERCNKKIAEHYETHTDLDYNQARDLMANETSITAEECKRIRFATEIEEISRPVALQQIFSTNAKTRKMANKNKEAKGLLNKLAELLTTETEPGQGKTKKNLEVFTDNQRALDFYELEEGETPSVGDKANIGGQPAQGEYKIAATGETYVFGNGTTGELTEIIAAEEEENEDIEALKQENEKLREQLSAQDSKIEAQNTKLTELEGKVNGFEKTWNSLKDAASEIKVEDKDDEPKGGQSPKEKGGLRAALERRKEK